VVRGGTTPCGAQHRFNRGRGRTCFGAALYFGASRTSAEREHGNHDWPNHGKDLANTRFQNLDQINPSNVKNLQVAWVFHTGVLDPLSELEASPIEVDGRLFITDGHDDVFALNAATGTAAMEV